MHKLRRHGLALAFRTISIVGIIIARIPQAAHGQDRNPIADAPGQPAAGDQREPPQPPPPVHRTSGSGAPREQDDELSPAYVARKQYLNGFLIRDRDYRILLTAAGAALERGADEQAIEALQNIWDAPRDVLVWDDSRQIAESVHHRADELLRMSSDGVRDTYERCYGVEAEQLLKSVLEDHDAAAERELLRRFKHTRAAGRLLQYKALRAMDHGDLREASGYWRRLVSDQWQHGSLDMPRTLQALYCCEQPEAIRAGVSQRGQDEIAGPGSPGDDLPPRTIGHSSVSAPVQEALWTTHFLDDAGNHDEMIRLVSGTSADGIDDDLEIVVTTWADRQRSHRLPLGGATAAVVAEDVVIVRDFEGVTAFGVQNGEVQWRYRCESSLCGALRDLSQTNDARSGRRRGSDSDLFAAQVADHSILSTLTTDGERLYLIDGIHRGEARDDAPAGPRRGDRVLRNRLVALAIGGLEPGRPVWYRGGNEETPLSGLDDFYFLGPPHPHQGNLYVIGERNEELYVVVLDAVSGRLRWKQPLSLVDLPVAESEIRSRRACRPLLSQNILVCPTHLPVLVGLDAITGTLLWVYHAAGEERPDSFTWPQHGGSEPDRHSGPPVIAGDRILFLPQDSRKLHCIDILSGRKLWCVDAAQTRFVACAIDDMVLLVNAHECTGLSLEDGQLQWRTAIEAPAGQGVLADGRYLLPLNSGQLAEIRLSDGAILPNLLASQSKETVGDERLQLADGFCGNLAVHEDLVVCCSPAGLAVFPQARPLLHRLRSEHSVEMPVAAADGLQRAELHIRLGEWSDAIEVLRSLLAADPPDPIRQRSIEHLRELLYVDIERNPGSGLEELAGLVSAPHEVARYLLHRLKHELNHGRLEDAVRTTREIRDLGVETLVRMDHEGRHLVLPLEQARFTLQQFRERAHREERERFETALRTSLLSQERNDTRRLSEAVRLLRGWSPDESLSQRLARRLAAAGERQAAESVRLSDHLTPVGLHPHDSQFLFDLSRPRPSTPPSPVLPGPPPQTLSRYLVGYGPRPSGRRVELEASERPQSSWAVDIREIECHEPGSEPPDECPCLRFAGVLEGRSHFLNANGTTVRLLETAGSSESAGRFTVISEDDFIELGAIETPPARWQLPASRPCNAGHLVPLRGNGVLMLSLLEQRELWHLPPDPEDEGRAPQLGPFGPDFCVLQSGQELTVVDPVTGRPLWKQRGLRYESGLSAGEETGIIGDTGVLVVFDADRVGFETFDTRSGASLGRGELPTGTGIRHLTSFGRRLLYRTEIDGSPRIRLWDPLAARLLLDDPAEGRFCWSPLADRQSVGLLTGHRLRVIDAETGECEWELDVAGEHLEHVRKIQMFSQEGVDFVLLERHMRDSPSNISGLDVRVTALDLSGDLYAVRRASGKSLWDSPLSVNPSKVLLLPHLGMPVLVTVSRVRDAQDAEKYRLKVDVIDIDSGRTLGSQSDLTITQILHADYNVRDARLALWGPDRRFEIGPAPQPAAPE